MTAAVLRRADIDRLAGPDAVAQLGLRSDMLDDRAVALLGFQRTKQITRASQLAWTRGEREPLMAEVRARRAAIIDGAVLEIYREYLPLRSCLSGLAVRPAHVIDIGCGQAINDLFLYRDFAPTLTLADIEQTEAQYHGWAAKGSGYASLDAAAGVSDRQWRAGRDDRDGRCKATGAASRKTWPNPGHQPLFLRFPLSG
jgi:hypothetical protein